jgi:UDP-N-acetylglucosamine 1-carboxyvinyltransferase
MANGETLIHDWVFEDRALYFTELNKLGAKVRLLDPHRVMIDGPTKFKAAEVICPPALRPATIILAAMLGAPGKSILRNVYSINRGYESLAERLRSLGAEIDTLHEL